MTDQRKQGASRASTPFKPFSWASHGWLSISHGESRNPGPVLRLTIVPTASLGSGA